MTAPPRRIESASNPDFRLWLRLSEGRGERGAAAQVLLEGRHLCEAWLAREGPPHTLIMGESARDLAWAQTLWRDCELSRRVVLHDALATQLSQVEHGPAVFCLVRPPVPDLPVRIEESCLCLDRVQDPGNLGTLLRTAAAAGLTRAFLSTGCAQAWSPKVLRSGQGAHFALQIYERLSLPLLFQRLAIPLAATALEGAVSLYDANLAGPRAWLFGNEGRGVAPDLLAQAAIRIRIPQEPIVESLNVAAAAAICLFEQRRQQRRAQ